MRILYFAWLREKIGLAWEDLDLPQSVKTVGTLITWLQSRNPAYAAAFSDPKLVRCAVDQEFAGIEASILDANEIAFFPCDRRLMIRILITQADFDAGAELQHLQAAGVGGIASFIGAVRDAGERTISALHLEHYPGMTERALARIAEQATTRWQLINCTVIHRVGRLAPRENIVFVGTASPHRQAALAATAFLIDWLKTSAPIWKREEFSNGETAWVAAREADEMAAGKWESSDF